MTLGPAAAPFLSALDEATDYIQGRFARARRPDGELRVVSPADDADTLGTVPYATAQVDLAVEAARAGARTMRRMSVEERVALLRAYQARLREHGERLAHAIAREVGKALWDARAEVAAMVSKIDVTVGEAARFTREEEIPDLPGAIRYRPHGVIAVIGPFNFPGHLPNGHIAPALFTGNAVIFKPSEKAPHTGTLLARCLHEAGVPPGTFQLVHGAGDVAAALVRHPGVDAVMFTGSLAVGRRILEATAHTPGKLVALELGGKNASIVLEDADLDRAAREVAFSAYASTGQRCTATSRLVVVREVADALVARIARAARSCVVGHPLDDGVFMGPLIGRSARDRLHDALRTARDAGFEAVVPSEAVEVRDGAGRDRGGAYVRPSLHLALDARAHAAGYTDCELFGPDLCVLVVRDDAEALEVAEGTRFGLSAAVYTASRTRFEALASELRVGVVHWNRSTAGASGRLPFGGIKDSGNHRPAGVLAGLQCTFAQAVLLAPPPPADARVPTLPEWPGLTFDPPSPPTSTGEATGRGRAR
jgi:succinylglutamic semialdehyde dehydrogenase